MNALIHKGTAVHGPGASPRSLFIIIFIAVPTNVGYPVEQSAKPSFFQSVPHGLNRTVKAVLVAGSYDYVPFFCSSDDGVSIRNGHGDRFFNHTMNALRNAV